MAQDNLPPDWPSWSAHPTLPCPHDCGNEIRYTLAVRRHPEDGFTGFYRLQEPKVCPNPDCAKPLPELPERPPAGRPGVSRDGGFEGFSATHDDALRFNTK
jgi:hypothetical protein